MLIDEQTWLKKELITTPYIDMTSRGKEELERLKVIASLPRSGESIKDVKNRIAREKAEVAHKALKAEFAGYTKERDKQEGIVYQKGLITGDNKGGCLTKWKAPDKNK